MQPKLLRVLDENKVMRIGGSFERILLARLNYCKYNPFTFRTFRKFQQSVVNKLTIDLWIRYRHHAHLVVDNHGGIPMSE